MGCYPDTLLVYKQLILGNLKNCLFTQMQRCVYKILSSTYQLYACGKNFHTRLVFERKFNFARHPLFESFAVIAGKEDSANPLFFPL